MITFAHYNALKKRIEELENDLKVLKNKPVYIGEVFAEEVEWGRKYSVKNNSIRKSVVGRYYTFKKFQKTDITDQVGANIKIFGEWFDIKDVIFYDNIFTDQRKNIYKRKEIKNV